jgi:hypothetical protein
MIKNLYKENGNSRRHLFDQRRQSYRHFRHFFRQNRHKGRHFNNPSKIEACLSEAADFILIEVIDIKEENFDYYLYRKTRGYKTLLPMSPTSSSPNSNNIVYSYIKKKEKLLFGDFL